MSICNSINAYGPLDDPKGKCIEIGGYMGIKLQVAANLKRLMTRDSVKQNKLASICQVDPSAVHGWIHGKSWPGDANIDAMMKELKWTEGEIFEGRDSSISELIRIHNASGSPFKIGLK